MQPDHKVKWLDSGREPTCKPNPAYPNGIVVDASRGGKSCKVDLPYPAKRCGAYQVMCKKCGATAMVTTAGRPDDPNAVIMACDLPKSALN